MNDTTERSHISESTQGRRAASTDPEMLRQTKMEKTAPFFRETKVQTCSHVLMKGGQAVAVPYPHKATGYKAKNSYVNQKRLPESTGFTHETYKVRPNLHAGLLTKPLEPYNPNAHRSRLPQATVIMPYKNASQIVIGDRSSDYKRQFVTSQKNKFTATVAQPISNPGILAERTKWQHHLQDL